MRQMATVVLHVKQCEVSTVGTTGLAPCVAKLHKAGLDLWTSQG